MIRDASARLAPGEGEGTVHQVRLRDELFYRFEPAMGPGGTLYLYHRHHGRVFKASHEAYVVVRALDDGAGPEEICRRVRAAYPESGEVEVGRFVEELLDRLERMDLIVSHETSGGLGDGAGEA